MSDVSWRRARQIVLLLAIGMVAVGMPVFDLFAHLGGEALFSRGWFRAAGAPFGMAAVILCALQFLIASRVPLLDRIVALNRQFRAHRVLGGAALLCALAHPLILFAPDLFTPWHVSLRHWPELLGALALVSLAGAACGAFLRKRLHIAFDRWLPLHRSGTLAIAVLAGTHFAFAEGHFEFGGTHLLLVAALAVFLVSFFQKGIAYRVTQTRPVGRDTLAIDLAPQTGTGLAYAPGQFALVTFRSAGLPRERHPWTISSAPTQGGALQFTIKKCGDFTSNIDRVQPGDSAFIKGPYGIFGQAALEDPAADLVLIAGGIGITPFLSMVRYLAAIGSTRRVVLIWSVRTAADMVWHEELVACASALPGLRLHVVMTRQQNPQGISGRLNAAVLQTLLADVPADCRIFICGPAGMRTTVAAGLMSCGYSPRRIVHEDFAL